MNQSLEKLPQLGTNPVRLNVKLPKATENDTTGLGNALRDLYVNGEFTDVAVVCAGHTFLAHKAVLAAASDVMFADLSRGCAMPAGSSGRQELRLADIANPEAVKLMLDFMYEIDASQDWKTYNPRTQEINKDVLRLARQFLLPALTEKATYWLGKDLTTGNVVERLSICEEFHLEQLRERIIEQLTYNRAALKEVAGSPQIMQHPKLMLALLQQTANAPDDFSPPKVAKDVLALRGGPKKKARKS